MSVTLDPKLFFALVVATALVLIVRAIVEKANRDEVDDLYDAVNKQRLDLKNAMHQTDIANMRANNLQEEVDDYKAQLDEYEEALGYLQTTLRNLAADMQEDIKADRAQRQQASTLTRSIFDDMVKQAEKDLKGWPAKAPAPQNGGEANK